jgi:hypothetical protein
MTSLTALTGTQAFSGMNMAAAKVAPKVVLPQLSEQDTRRIADQQATASAAMGKLKSTKTDSSANRKEAARKEIDRIKKILDALRRVGGDPKSVARQAAQLARELKAAVKDFTEASDGAASDAAGASAAVPSAGEAPSGREAAKADGSSETKSETGPEAKSEAKSEATPDAASEAGSDGKSQDTSDADAALAAANSASQAATPSSAASATSAQDAERADRQAFADDVRDLARKLNRLIEKQRIQARLNGDRESEDKLGDARNDMRQTDGMLGNLAVVDSVSLPGIGGGANIAGGVSVAGGVSGINIKI